MSVQTLLELVWEYWAQMKARQLSIAFEYVANCRHWTQFRRERKQSIQSQQDFSTGDGDWEAHLPTAASSGRSPQRSPSPRHEPSVSVSISEPSSAGHRSEFSLHTDSLMRRSPASRGIRTQSRTREFASAEAEQLSHSDMAGTGQEPGATATRHQALNSSQELGRSSESSSQPRQSAGRQLHESIAPSHRPAPHGYNESALATQNNAVRSSQKHLQQSSRSEQQEQNVDTDRMGVRSEISESSSDSTSICFVL